MLEKMHSSLNETALESSPTSSLKAQLLHNLKDSKEYRRAFVEEKVRTQLAVQIKTIREQRQMGRTIFAVLLGKVYSWVFRLEDPNQAPPTVPSLLNVADVFDVDLDIKFRRFSDLLNQIEYMGPESLKVPSFEEELKNGAFDVIEMRVPMNTAASETPDNDQKQRLNVAPPVRAEGRQLEPREAMVGGQK
jgi:hypothetical protein